MAPPPEHVRADEVDAALTRQLAPTALVVRDDSAAHAGHAGAREGSHLHVTIVSARFDGLGRLARHRLVYDALRELIPRGIHALAIDARTPSEAGPGSS
ncbi:BolA family protein [Ideonella alba]|uniref:BolA family transcriptional regulator n=1 Tax=Ideonella alba TaxID=2824118 RepID=A0A941BGL9_9BURK|nr:BolA family protein [Ideonella alba]MBQ0932237.1 BolA family transcriptional regulator [Ideonella alba]